MKSSIFEKFSSSDIGLPPCDIGDSKPYADDPIANMSRSIADHYMKDILSSYGESYWGQEFYNTILSEESYGMIWDLYPSLRGEMVAACTKVARKQYYGRESLSLTDEFSSLILSNVYSCILNDEEYSDETHLPDMLKLIEHGDPDFDYLSKVSSYFLMESDEESNVAKRWTDSGLKNSCDPLFYDYCYAKVKRSKGSAKRRLYIVECAIQNDALSDSLIAKIAKSSPKSIKRKIVTSLSERISSSRNMDDGADKALEARAMLFVANDDRQILDSLICCLSKDNLPWLMPYVSSYPWLSRRLQYRIEELTE